VVVIFAVISPETAQKQRGGLIFGSALGKYTIPLSISNHRLGNCRSSKMPDKFDPYREALVVETVTVWTDDYDHLNDAEKVEVEAALHADPENCSQLEYVRMHTGFCRSVTVTEDDLERIG
jgi:hypothetical protein